MSKYFHLLSFKNENYEIDCATAYVSRVGINHCHTCAHVSNFSTRVFLIKIAYDNIAIKTLPFVKITV